MGFLVCSVRFSIVLGICASAFAESPNLQKAEIEAALNKHDLDAIRGLVEPLEKGWVNREFDRYFDNIGLVCETMLRKEDITLPEYALFQTYASEALLRVFSLGEPRLIAQRGDPVALMLVSEVACLAKASPAEFAIARSRNARLLMVFMAGVRKATIPHFSPKPIFLNIAPPVNVDNEPMKAGMDPAKIKNPESRAAYEKALQENARNAKEKGEQQELRSTAKSVFPFIERYLVATYAHEPPDFSEMAEYLTLGAFAPERIAALLKEAQKKSEGR